MLLIIIPAIIIFLLPFLYYAISDRKRLSLDYTFRLGLKDFFTLWIALFGVMGVTIGIIQTSEIIKNQERQFSKQIDRQDKQLRDGRFSTGVELMGNISESVRIGGVYNLFFLASEYPEEYKQCVFEILCSHIRTTTSQKEYQETFKKEPSNEIQTILNLLFKKEHSHKAVLKNHSNIIFDKQPSNDLDPLSSRELDERYATIFNELEIELAEVYLCGADLTSANLSRANLRSANLTNVNFSQAKLCDAWLFYANLTNANLNLFSDLTNANLNHTILDGANFTNAVLVNVQLCNTSAIKTGFKAANLKGAFLDGGNFSYADFEMADLSDVHLDSAFYEDFGDFVWQSDGTNLSNANLIGVTGFDIDKARKFGSKIEGSRWGKSMLGEMIERMRKDSTFMKGDTASFIKVGEYSFTITY